MSMFPTTNILHFYLFFSFTNGQSESNWIQQWWKKKWLYHNIYKIHKDAGNKVSPVFKRAKKTNINDFLLVDPRT